MNSKSEFRSLLWILGFFLLAYYLPVGRPVFDRAVGEALALVRWYAREHVLLCLVPAFFIAGTIAVFVSQAAVVKYFGAGARKWLAYLVASVSGTILAVCSCTVLPLFSSIHKRGAGLGPAIAFLYSGPAINILAIILTARILGPELGIARVVGAVGFSILIGLAMQFLFRREEQERTAALPVLPVLEEPRPLWLTAGHFFILVAILVFANWGRPDVVGGPWWVLYRAKWLITAIFGLLLAVSLVRTLGLRPLPVTVAVVVVAASALLFPAHPAVPFTIAVVLLSVLLSAGEGEPREWLTSSWGFAKQILPLLAAGVLVAGFLLGGPGEGSRGIIPNEWISGLVGGNSLGANLAASVAGAFMYFATLTEVPIVQGLLASGMGKGPALALLLAGPALSLPNMLVIRSVIGTKKTVAFVSLVVVMATLSGLLYGALF
jgi:uncharacterized membrane protein YraQ (UPF0718 family)